MTGALGLLLGGCALLQQTNPIATEGMANRQIEVRPPTAVVDGDVLVISGDVRRQPGMNDPIFGHIEITIYDPMGKPIELLPALITPNPIPTAGRAESQYLVRLGLIPATGSSIKAIFVLDPNDKPVKTD